MTKELQKGNKFEFKEYEYHKSLEVFAWSLGSALVTFVIALVAATEVPPQYVAFIPLVNTLLYAVKKYIEDNTVV